MKLHKKLILSLAVALFACASFVTTTFAWFTIAQDATVGDLSMSITGGGELLVSLDGVNYSGTIKKEELEKVIGKNHAITNVTSTNLNDFYASYDTSNISQPNKDYITFTLWFKANDENCNGLFLTNNITPQFNYEVAEKEALKGTFVYSKGVNYSSTVDFQYSETETRRAGDKYKYHAADAMRIGIKELNNDSKNLQEADTRENLAKFIFDPTEDKERGFGSIYGAFDLFNRKNSIQLVVPELKPDTKYQLSKMEYNYYAINNDSLCATFQKGTDGYNYSKIQVSIWCEGWDADCMDGILSDQILMQLYFRCAVPAQQN